MTPANPSMSPAIIHLVIFVQDDNHTLNNTINNGTSATMIAANPPLIYCMAQVSNPFAIHKRKIPWIDILFSSFKEGSLYPFNKKKLTNKNPEMN